MKDVSPRHSRHLGKTSSRHIKDTPFANLEDIFARFLEDVFPVDIFGKNSYKHLTVPIFKIS